MSAVISEIDTDIDVTSWKIGFWKLGNRETTLAALARACTDSCLRSVSEPDCTHGKESEMMSGWVPQFFSEWRP